MKRFQPHVCGVKFWQFTLVLSAFLATTTWAAIPPHTSTGKPDLQKISPIHEQETMIRLASADLQGEFDQFHKDMHQKVDQLIADLKMTQRVQTALKPSLVLPK